MKVSLKDRLFAYHKARPGMLIPSGEMQRVVTQHTSYSAANATRRLRELAEEGELQVELIKGHAHYRYVPPVVEKKCVVVIEDGVAKEVNQLVENV